jgi:serine/threonine protein kinase/pSer/pThr/pTyr-binding forkhead associated (FHA) protein
MSQAKLEDVTNVSGHPFFTISKPVIDIGRSLENDIVVFKNTVSSRHATIEQKPDGYFIVDQNSSNKTQLNGVELDPNSPQKLNDGDEIKIDTFPFVFKLEDIEPPPPPPDDDGTIFLDSSSPMEEVKEDEPSQPAAADDETVFFDSSSPMDEIKAAEPAPAAPDYDETVFLDSSSMADEAKAAEPPPPAPDHDETVFFDSGSLMEEVKAAEPSQPAPDHDETVFFDSGSLTDEVKEGEFAEPAHDPDRREDAGDTPPFGEEKTVRRMKPEAVSESTKIGNYEIIKLLGKGGFGSVWKARASDGRPVAIKVLNPDVLEDDRAVRKFFHEAINLSKMDHPNICRFYDFFPHEGNYAIVMDFVQGTNLQDLLKSQGGPLPFDTARMIASQALDAFHYAHEKQVLHRDIKPENITLTTEGVAKVMDFGIAKLSSSESQQTSLYMISPAYTAPERFDEKKTETVDHRSDIYSLGLVFYEIFTGKHPFPVNTPMEMIIAHLSKAPTPPDQILGLPQEINDGILKALEKNPEDRFEDFAAFKMEMLGEATLRVSQSIGPLEFSGEHCKAVAELLKTLSGIVKKHQKKAEKITVGQLGTQVDVIIETIGGNIIRISRDIEKMRK